MTLNELASPGDAIDYLVTRGFKASEAVELVGNIIKIGKGKRLASSPKPAAPSQAKRPFPEDFVLSPELAKFATDRSFTRPEIDSMWIKFKNRNLRDGSLYSNWSAAWRTWVMHAVDYRNRDNRARAPDLIDWRA